MTKTGEVSRRAELPWGGIIVERMSYRYPTERRTLAITLLITITLVVLLSPFTLGGAALLVVVGFVMNALMTALSVRRIRRSAQRIERFPDLAALVELQLLPTTQLTRAGLLTGIIS